MDIYLILQITLLNPTYFSLLGSVGSDFQYALHTTPQIILESLRQLTELYNHEDGMSETMRMIGYVSDNNVDTWYKDLQYPDGFSHLAYGQYVAQQNNQHSRTVIDYLKRDFSRVEMYGLYEALSNPDLLGATQYVLTDQTFRSECMKHTTVPKDFSLTYHFYPPSMLPPQTTGANSKPCGLIFALKRFQDLVLNGSQEQVRNITDVIAQYLCTNSSFSCFTLPEDDATRVAFIQTVSDYLFLHLPKYIFYKSVILIGEPLLVTRPQHEFALGYTLGRSTVSQYSNKELEKFVPGILPHAKTYLEARAHGTQMAVYNCYDATGAKTNFMWKCKYMSIIFTHVM